MLQVPSTTGTTVRAAGAAARLVHVTAQVPGAPCGPLVLPTRPTITLVRGSVEELLQPPRRLLSRLQQVQDYLLISKF